MAPPRAAGSRVVVISGAARGVLGAACTFYPVPGAIDPWADPIWYVGSVSTLLLCVPGRLGDFMVVCSLFQPVA